MMPRPGDVVHVGRRASVQFCDQSAITVRVITVDEKPTYHGWCWLTAYVLDPSGQAVDRREIFVQPAGLLRVGPPHPDPTARVPVPGSAVPAQADTRGSEARHAST